MRFAQAILTFLFLPWLAFAQAKTDNPNVWNFQIARKVIGSFQFNGMGLSIWEDQGMADTNATSRRQFYVTPMAQFLPDETICEYNDLTDTYFVSYTIQLWNDRLQLAAIDRLKIMQIVVAPEQVQPLPFYQVRVLWDNPQAKLKKAELSAKWNNNLQQRSVQRFTVYTEDQQSCASLNTTLRSKPDLWTDSIALQYSLSAASTATRTLSVKVEHFQNSLLMASLKNMDVQTPERYLTSTDANRLSLEITQNVIASQVIDGDYVPESDQITLKDIVTSALQFANTDSSNFTQQQWQSVFWDPIYARPNKVTSYLNKVLNINSGNHTVSKSNQYSNKDEGGFNFGLDSIFSLGGKSSSQDSGSSSFSELFEWFKKNSYEVEIKGEIFIPKKLDLKRVNMGVLTKKETIYTKSVQIHHVDAPGAMKVTSGRARSTTENDDVKRLRERVDKLEPRAGQLEGRAGQLENRAGKIEDRAGQLESRAGALEQRAGHLDGAVHGVLKRCRICFQETEGSSQCQGTRASCSGWSNAGVGWTAPFRDDTDNRGGGCTYQWRVECLGG